MSAAQVTQAGVGEAMEMQQEAGGAKATRQGARGAAQMQIRARIMRVGSEYRKAVTAGTCELCITDWAALSSPSASSRPSKPAPAPPKWSSVSTVPTSMTTTGTRSSSSSRPDASRVTPTKDEPLVDTRSIREGRPFLSRKARWARRENGEKRSAKRPRKNSSPVTLVTVPQEFSISLSLAPVKHPV